MNLKLLRRGLTIRAAPGASGPSLVLNTQILNSLNPFFLSRN